MAVSVLIVEDEIRLANTLRDLLDLTGFTSDICHDGESGLDNALSAIYDVILLDVMLPGMDGIEILTKMKESAEFCNIPVIMATAKGQEYDRIHGLDLGADDYMVKPFSIMELVSRVKAVLRRSQPRQVSKLLKTGGLVVNLDEHTVMVDGNKVQLTYKEFELLRMFLSHPGMVYTREQLFAQVWQMDYMGDSRTLDSHIRTLRQKLDGYGKMIETVRNVGYRWEAGYDK